MDRQDQAWIERRAAELGLDAPRDLPGSPGCLYTYEEFRGWSINYWDRKGEVPDGREQWAGWLAREVYLGAYEYDNENTLWTQPADSQRSSYAKLAMKITATESELRQLVAKADKRITARSKSCKKAPK